MPVVEVVRHRGPRPTEPPSAPLPPAVLSALTLIVREMRDVPRDCIIDRAELLHWLRRMANRIESVGRMRVPIALPKPVPAVSALARPVQSARDAAEAVFGKAPSVVRAPGPRTIVSRKGRAVRVEVLRARASGQLELGL